MPGPERPLLPCARKGQAGHILREGDALQKEVPTELLPSPRPRSLGALSGLPRVQAPLERGQLLLYPVTVLTAGRGTCHQPGSGLL